MKLATIHNGTRDGSLVVVSRDGKKVLQPSIKNVSSMIEAIRDWKRVEPLLLEVYGNLNKGLALGSQDASTVRFMAPLPNAPGFYDGSAFLSHVVRARRARGDQMPESAKVTPLMYQGVSDCLLGPHDEIRTLDESYGADFEGEFAVITNDVPLGTPAQAMASHLILFSVFNDITYREIIKQEIETKFGFLQSKPNSSFAPFLVTPDELGAFWDGKRINLPLEIYLNGQLFGRPVGREMHFTFPELVAHACRTRPLSAGSIVGTGTVSNEDKAAGFACLTEKRFQEILDTGKAVTPWLKKGDRVRIDCFIQGNQKTESIFGKIDQDVV